VERTVDRSDGPVKLTARCRATDSHRYALSITVDRGARDDAAWRELLAQLALSKPQVFAAKERQIEPFLEPEFGGDDPQNGRRDVVFQYYDSWNDAFGKPADAARIEWSVPTKWRGMSFPLELDDIPLP
jgi:hypothetical protein